MNKGHYQDSASWRRRSKSPENASFLGRFGDETNHISTNRVAKPSFTVLHRGASVGVCGFVPTRGAPPGEGRTTKAADR